MNSRLGSSIIIMFSLSTIIMADLCLKLNICNGTVCMIGTCILFC